MKMQLHTWGPHPGTEGQEIAGLLFFFFFLLLFFFPSGFPKQTVSFEPVAPSGRAPASPQGAVPKPARLNPWKRDRGAGASSERV